MNLPEFKTDRTLGTPIYKQIYRTMVRYIQDGVFRPGERLPGKRALAEKANVSYNTVMSVYDELIKDGLVVSVERRGFFVAGTEDDSIYKGSPWVMPDKRKYIFSLHGNGISHLSKKFERAMRDMKYDIEKRLLSYKEQTGNTALREKICEYLHVTGRLLCDPEQIILCCGYTYAIDTAAKTLGNELTFALENPTNGKINEIAASGRRCRYIPTSLDGIDIPALRRSDADVLICMPEKQIPTGCTMDMDTRFALLEWLENNKYIIEYGYNCDFCFGNSMPSLYTLNNGERVIYINSFEYVSAPGITVAYMVLPQNLIPMFKERLPLYQCCISEFDSLVMLEYISNKGIFSDAKRLRKLYENKRDAALKAFRELPIADKLTFFGTETGTHFCVKVSTEKSAAELTARLQLYDVKMLRISSFSVSELKEEKVYVFGYGEPSAQTITEGIRLIGEAWADI